MALVFEWYREPIPERRQALMDAAGMADRLDPDNPYGEVIRGWILGSTEDPAQATVRFSRVARRGDLAPGMRAWALRMKAGFEGALGDHAAALSSLEQALESDPVDPSNLLALARTLRDAGRLEESLTRARQGTALAPGNPMSWLRTGIVLNDLERYADAATALRRACDMSRRQEACSLLAMTFLEDGRAGEAAGAAAEATKLTPEIMGQYNLACYEARSGNPQAAIAHLRKALGLGYAHADFLSDPDLDSLRGDPEFETLASEVEKRLAPE
jgi:tetratricopeptide (TPR) repeat protein